ncbi:MAG: IS1634 family transposase, partial [Mariprofundaceae bacterium]
MKVSPNRNSPPAILLRESRREGRKVIKKTVANLSKWPVGIVTGLKILLKGGVALDHNDSRVSTTRTLPHGHVAAVLGTLRKTGLDKIIGLRNSRQRSLVLGMITSRIISPASKFATLQTWNDETATSSLGGELGISDASEQEVYEALYWLYSRQPVIEQKLARKHLQDGCLILCDVSASYYTGTHCNLAQFGHKKDRKLGVTEIVYGLMCDARGCPVGIQVFEGNTSDPKVFSEQMVKVKEKFGIERLIMVGDRGLITQARITEDLVPVDGMDWISALRSSAIQKLVTTGALQLSLFDKQDMAEITSDDFPGERLVVCRNPLLADERARKRQALLTATEALLQEVVDATQREKRPFKGKDKIALRIGKIINKYKMSKHFILTIEEDSFSFERDNVNIDKEASLDGFYVIRTSVNDERMGARQTVQTYKSLAHVEQAFRSMKSVDLQIRPIFHRLDDRV